MRTLWLLSVLTFSLFSENTAQDDGIANSYMLAVKSKAQMKKQNDCTTCCNPEINYRLPADWRGVETFAEYLLWQLQEQASYFVSIAPPVQNAYPCVFAQGPFKSQPFNWSSGVRVGLGYNFGQTKWQILGQYTWYNTRGQIAYTTPPNVLTNFPSVTFAKTPWLQPVVVTEGGPFVTAGDGITKASTSAYFSYQMADFLINSLFFATKQIQFNYSLGATGGYILEHWDVKYRAAGNLYVPNNASWHNHWHFGGGGFRAGINTTWHIGGGFGIFNQISFAGILGQYVNKAKLTWDAPLHNAFGTVFENLTYKTILLLPTSQCILGLNWKRNFSNCRIRAIEIALSAEFNYLSDLHQVFKGYALNDPNQDKVTNRDVGSVYMYGATAHLGTNF